MKTPEQKHWRGRYRKYCDEHGNWLPNSDANSLEDQFGPPDVVIEDVVWSRESGSIKQHRWSENAFRAILEQRGHWKRKHQGKEKRTTLASKYRYGRSKTSKIVIYL